MNKRYKLSLIVAGALIMTSVVVVGVNNLNAKLDEVKALNEQIADASEEGKANEKGRPEDEVKETDKGQTGQTPEPGVKPGQSSGSPESTHTPDSTQLPKSTPKPSEPGVYSTPKPENPSTAKPLSTEDQEQNKQEIDANMTARMESLRAACQSTSSRLVAQIKQELASNEEASMETIQSKYLTQIIAAEAGCDAQFNLLLSDAKAQYSDAGLNEEALPNWSTEYENAKSQVRSNALVEIANALQ